jgi:10 TM Acyl Transferase domain found in Cas1p
MDRKGDAGDEIAELSSYSPKKKNIMKRNNSSSSNAKSSAWSFLADSLQQSVPHWKGRKDFLVAQGQVGVVLAVAYVGNHWPVTYPRNDNHKPLMFWVMNAALVVAGLATLKHDPHGSARGVQLLSRPQTEEWKGWMQWAFIMVCVDSLEIFTSFSLSMCGCVSRETTKRKLSNCSALVYVSYSHFLSAALSIITIVCTMSTMRFEPSSRPMCG